MTARQVRIIYRTVTIIFLIESIIMIIGAQQLNFRFGKEIGHELMVTGIVIGAFFAGIMLLFLKQLRYAGPRTVAFLLSIIMMVLCIYYPTQIN